MAKEAKASKAKVLDPDSPEFWDATPKDAAEAKRIADAKANTNKPMKHPITGKPVSFAEYSAGLAELYTKNLNSDSE